MKKSKMVVLGQNRGIYHWLGVLSSQDPKRLHSQSSSWAFELLSSLMVGSTKCNVEQEGGKAITASHCRCMRQDSGFEKVLKRNQEAKAWWFCLCSPSAGAVANCPQCLYLNLLCDYLLINGLSLLTINDLNYILNQNKNNKICPQSLVSSLVLYTYFSMILEGHQI